MGNYLQIPFEFFLMALGINQLVCMIKAIMSGSVCLAVLCGAMVVYNIFFAVAFLRESLNIK